MSGLANKTCTGTSKRYQLCKVQVRISFVSLGKSVCKAVAGISGCLGEGTPFVLQLAPCCPYKQLGDPFLGAHHQCLGFGHSAIKTKEWLW